MKKETAAVEWLEALEQRGVFLSQSVALKKFAKLAEPLPETKLALLQLMLTKLKADVLDLRDFAQAVLSELFLLELIDVRQRRSYQEETQFGGLVTPDFVIVGRGHTAETESIAAFAGMPGLHAHQVQHGGDFYTLENVQSPKEAWDGRAVVDSERARIRRREVVAVFVGSRGVRTLSATPGRRLLTKCLQWLRRRGMKLGLLVTRKQWRLLYVGPDFFAAIDTAPEAWLDAGSESLQLRAFRTLLNSKTLQFGTGFRTELELAVEESRNFEAELSSHLAERIRDAVDLLASEAAKQATQLGVRLEPSDLLTAVLKVMMRCIAVLFAEGRNLLPLDNETYRQSYSLSGLIRQLEHDFVARGRDELSARRYAWRRLVSLFRAVYYGSPHPDMMIPSYGGELFAPGNPNSNEGSERALAFLETLFQPDDALLYQVLSLATKVEHRIKLGRRWSVLTVPIDFSSLSSEYIGVFYEGLLDLELRQAQEPLVVLATDKQPVLPLSRLKELPVDSLKQLLKGKSQEIRNHLPESASSGESTNNDSEVADEQSAKDALQLVKSEFAQLLVKAGLAPRPDGKDPESMIRHQIRLAKTVDRYLLRVILPGQWYLVRYGGTRKGGGVFYTPPVLAQGTVERTLQPLCFADDGTPAQPEKILNLKVVDPAMGSGSFLVAATRYLANALRHSLYYHKRVCPVKLENGHRSETLVTRIYLTPPHADSSKCRQNSEPVVIEIPGTPDDPDFDDRLLTLLKRQVVENCIYGVDIDPVACELAKLSLWLETMDRSLPFTFLDHKLKVGNSLVGASLQQLSLYPVRAWYRKLADKDHSPAVHVKPGEWTEKLTQRRRQIEKELKHIAGLLSPQLPFANVCLKAEAARVKLKAVLEAIHRLPVHECDKRRRKYNEEYLANPERKLLKKLMDRWCAVWFWPVDKLELAPGPLNFFEQNDEVDAVVEKVASKLRFFHWELEYPDVFFRNNPGFDAVVTNPPWDVQKPLSQEYFSNIDPIYRTYRKQEALKRQKQLFEQDKKIELDWLEYKSKFKALSHWFSNLADPVGKYRDLFTHRTAVSEVATGQTESRKTQSCVQGPSKAKAKLSSAPFTNGYTHQGLADVNTYKLFIERTYNLLAAGGRAGIVAPSGLYADEGCRELRKLLIDHARWEWVFGFENRKKIFDIDSRFKFHISVFEKSGSTDMVKTAFMRHDATDWLTPEKVVIPYPVSLLRATSPNSLSFLEVGSRKQMDILQKMLSSAVSLGELSRAGKLRLNYAQEFHMTGDSILFKPTPWWEKRGFKPTIYGWWEDGRGNIAVPLYQGVMIWQFDPCYQAWERGTGLGARWTRLPNRKKMWRPQYLMDIRDFASKSRAVLDFKILHRQVARATDERTSIAALAPPFPAGHKAPSLVAGRLLDSLSLPSLLNSFAVDYYTRCRVAGTGVDQHHLFSIPIPELDKWRIKEVERSVGGGDVTENESGVLVCPKMSVGLALVLITLRLNGIYPVFAPLWLEVAKIAPWLRKKPWQQWWAVTEYERLRLRCIADALVAWLYGLDYHDLAWILRQCAYPPEKLKNKAFTATLDPRGFWRVDQDKPLQLRHTFLTLHAFVSLKFSGVEWFTRMAWDFPQMVKFEGKELEVKPLLGPVYEPWQLSLDPEQSWDECKRCAEKVEEFMVTLQKVRRKKEIKNLI